jgi:hypothetical protein
MKSLAVGARTFNLWDIHRHDGTSLLSDTAFANFNKLADWPKLRPKAGAMWGMLAIGPKAAHIALFYPDRLER